MGSTPTARTTLSQCLRLLPASAESLIQLHQALVLVAACLGKSKLGGKERSLPVQDFKVGRDASLDSV